MNASAKPIRTASISSDRFGVGVFAIVLVTIVMMASFTFSYVGIVLAAEWVRLPADALWVTWLAPVFVDGAILAYTVSLTIALRRGEEKWTVRRLRAGLYGFTALSVTLNFSHTAGAWDWTFVDPAAWIGSLIAVSAPIAVLMSTEAVVHMVFRYPRVETPASDALSTAETVHVLEGAPPAEPEWPAAPAAPIPADAGVLGAATFLGAIHHEPWEHDHQEVLGVPDAERR